MFMGGLEKKKFRGNDNSLTGEVKHKSMRFSLDKKKHFFANQNSHNEQQKQKNNMKVL